MACNGMASSSSSFSPNFMLQMQAHHEEEHQQLAIDPVNPLLATTPFINLQDLRGEEMKADDDFSDDGLGQAAEKKKRLNVEQVRTLEKSFEMGNKLEPERKLQLARFVGLQPRQVAIWFQNRRARCKTKQLEKDYDELKRQFEAIKSENETLRAQNNKLQAEILSLKGRSETSEALINLNKLEQTEASCSNRSENSSEINLDISRTASALDQMPLRPHHQYSVPFFHTMRPTDHHSVDQLLQSSSSSELCPKIDTVAAAAAAAAEGNHSNRLLSSTEDHQPAALFWSWPDYHNFH